MFGKKYEAAHADWPKTSVTRDGGVHVTGKYWKPHSEEGWRTLYLVASGIAAVCAAATGGGFGPGIAIFVFLVIAWELIFKRVAFFLFGKNLNLKIYPDRIAVPSYLGYRNYSRAMPIEFRIEQHHLALSRDKAKWYHDAIEAVMQYGEKRVALAAMPQKNIELARALVIRLQNVCDSVDMALPVSGTGKMKPAGTGDFGPVPDIR